ncbi:MAG: hypothetical protein HY727_21280 [Candidatus Rokubacteria bacterium]|nr:hypothetical protein [Candidatus Rokubacteria bacterium]
MPRLIPLISLAFVFGTGLLGGRMAVAQTVTPASPPPLSLGALIDQTLAVFPEVEGDVVEARGPVLTLSPGRRSGVQPGLTLEVFREGREIRHPRTGQLLGKAEQPLGRAVVTEVFEGYSFARLDGEGARPGDRVRAPSGKVKLMLLPLAGGGVKDGLIEAMTNEIYEGLNRSGRFQVVLGDPVGLWLAQERIKPEEFLGGRGVREAFERFKAENILALHFKQVQKKPFLEARLFSTGRADPMLTTAFVVPPSIKPAQPGRFSASDRTQSPTPEKKPKSLLARLLGGDLEPGTYSSGESSIPLKEVARLGFTVVSMDVSVAPADRIPRLAITDGDRVWVYRIVDRALEAEWTYSARAIGRYISVQLADLQGDGVLSVVANRFDSKIGMNSAIIGLRGGKPAAIVENVSAFLIAVDERGTGVKQTLWAQRYSEESFFTKGQADQVVVKNGALVKERAALVPDTFRATGATFSNIAGNDRQALAFVDEQNRLRITAGADEIWRSSSAVGGGGQKIEVVRMLERGGRSYFYQMEPAPLSIDLDGDGVQEVIVPQNHLEGGILGVAYRGPAGIRFQQVNSGFEGVIAGMGAIPSDDGGSPTLVAAIVRYKDFLKVSGETQIIMTTPD